MSLSSDKISISRLVQICYQKGLRYVVISPGSRNAPLTLSFAEHPGFECLNIPDERSAAFFAMGMAQRLQTPVILCCTSGSAVLNYAPAISEAYYQRIPLLVLTADRPMEWIDQRAGQTIRQRNIFSNYIKHSYEIIEEAQQAEHIWYNDRIVNEAINEAASGAKGPIHINIPMREPLYSLVSADRFEAPKVIHFNEAIKNLPNADLEQLSDEIEGYHRIMIVVGQRSPSGKLEELLDQFGDQFKVIVLTETTSNLQGVDGISTIDRAIDGIRESELDNYTPDLLISFGGAVVSKKNRFLFRSMKIKAHWHVDANDGYIDTYQALTRLIQVDPEYFLESLIKFGNSKSDDSFLSTWKKRDELTRLAHDQFLSNAPWSDLKVFEFILSSIPSGDIHFASSTPIRYCQLFVMRPDLVYYCNRGVSGIDGCTSTAAGFAYVNDRTVSLITGDIAFFYDSNGLWHHHLSKNLKIILINNGGGNIFRYVSGPDQTDYLEEHFEASHSNTAEGISRSYNIGYKSVGNMPALVEGLQWLYDESRNNCALLEIQTPGHSNIDLLKEYFEFLPHTKS